MKRAIGYFSLTILMTVFAAGIVSGQRRGVVVHHPHPLVRTRPIVHPGHPIHRALPANVVLRNARRTVVVHHPLVYLPALRWRPAIVPLPPRERIVWTDTQTIAREEEWVDTNYGVDASGSALYLDISGKTKLNFAEVTYDDGHVQVVDLNDEPHDPGVYKLLDLPANQHVATVRILAKSESDESKLAVHLSK